MPSISDDARESVVVALVTVFPNTDSFDDFLLVKLSKIRNHIVNDGTHPHQVTRVVEDAENKDWLQPLLKKALQENAGHPLLEIAIEKISEEAGDADGNPYEACLLAGSDHFVGRRELREYVRRLAGKQSKKILRVHGKKDTGRSFTLDYISHIYSDSKAVNRLSFELDKFIGESEPVIRLVTKICFQLNLETAGMPDRPDDIGDWLIGRLKVASNQNGNSSNMLWLIFDNCDAPGLVDNGINTFIGFLADQITNIPKFRMVLLAKKDAVANEVEEKIEIPAGDPEKKKIVKRHLKRFLQFRKIAFMEEDLDAHVEKVVGMITDPFFPGVTDALTAWELEDLVEEED